MIGDFHAFTSRMLKVLLACAITALTPGHGAAFDKVFDTWWGFDIGSYPEAFWAYDGEAADLNGDGAPEVVSANWWFPEVVSILPNNGDGSYGQPIHLPTGSSSQQVEIADFTGDGWADIVVACGGPHFQGTTVALHRNLGGLGFAPFTEFLSGVGPMGMAAADFNGDGRLDLAVCNWETHGLTDEISLLLNNGSGGFLPPVAYPAAAGPYRLEAGDLTGDGRPDLAVACVNRTLAVLPNIGGAFGPPATYLAGGPGPADFFPSVQIADTDEDGDRDVLYTSTATSLGDDGAIALFRNPGSGSLVGPILIPLPAYLGGGTSMRVADLTGDGAPDIVTTHGDSGGWVLTENLGNGTFTVGRELGAGDDPFTCDISDADADGDPDILMTDAYSMTVAIYENDGTGAFSDPPAYDVEPLSGEMDEGDIDRDGDLDFVTAYAYAGGGGLSVIRNNGDGTFAPRTTLPGPRGAMAPQLRDLNGDQAQDVVWAADNTSPPYNFFVRLNNGDGTLAQAREWPVGTCGTGDLEMADVDGDGDLDVLLSDWLECAGDDTPWLWISRNNGNGTFQVPYYIIYETSPGDVKAGDVNGDGRVDIFTTHAEWLHLVLGNGDGTFGPPSTLEVPWGPTDVALADLNGDGHADVAVPSHGGAAQSSLSILLGNGDGTFQPRREYRGTHSADQARVGAIDTGDADGDGDIDVMAVNYAAGDVSYWENLGDGTLRPHVRYGVGPAASDVAFADFTGDGVGDLAALIGTPPSDLPRRITIVPATRGSTSAGDAMAGPRAQLMWLAGPHPSSGPTEILYKLERAAEVRLSIHDLAGRMISLVDQGPRASGEHRKFWHGLNNAGLPVPRGIYFARLRAGDLEANARILRLE